MEEVDGSTEHEFKGTFLKHTKKHVEKGFSFQTIKKLEAKV